MSNTRVTNPVTGFNSATEEGLKLPSGTNANQPSGVQGMIRNDTGETTGSSASAIEHHNGTNWQYFAATESADNPFLASQNFNTVLYPGTGVSNSITGVGFQPDLIWVKRRTTSTANHYIVDTVRGNGTSTYKNLSSDTTNVEGTTTASGITNSTIVDGGFTMQGTGARTNASGSTYVAWCWKGGGLINKAADFNGSSSYIYNAGLGLSGNTTISFWVKPEATQNQYANIIDCNHSSSGGFTIQQNSNNINQYSFTVNNSGTFNSTGYFSLTNNVWSNVVITLDSSGNANVIVNNNSVATGVGLSGLSSNALSIGRWIGGSSRYFNGLIGQVRFFNQVLASSDITALYNETVADNSVLNYPQNAGCIAAYPLGENANDLSNTYNGTASNVTFGKPGYLTRNTEGTIESTVSANVAGGFSIVSWSGNNTTGGTIGHGLSSTPELTIIKKTSGAAADWQVSLNASVTGVEGYMNFNKTAALYTTYPLYYTSSNSTVLSSNGTSTATRLYNNQSENYIAYCFHSVAGYSKVGSYTGNGSTSTGKTIDLGFQPAFIMIKNITTTGSSSGWFMIDNKRNTSDPWNKYIFANNNAAEGTTTLSLTSVGATSFTVKSSGRAINYNGDNYIYMAFATS